MVRVMRAKYLYHGVKKFKNHYKKKKEDERCRENKEKVGYNKESEEPIRERRIFKEEGHMERKGWVRVRESWG